MRMLIVIVVNFFFQLEFDFDSLNKVCVVATVQIVNLSTLIRAKASTYFGPSNRIDKNYFAFQF